MRFVVAELWGNVATPLATVSVLHAPPVASLSSDHEKVGFTLDVTQRLVDASLQGSPLRADAPATPLESENLADSA